ncbi:peptide-methionine (S)-S-oxide reductase MsrA [Actinomyces lilanjuaniae]|uniref:Peptide methionine sulfoxide reductase MsrA n=1 Tax=Actinomyces lilanjuaniae TaxID=2321394 RepID=A0ABM6Z4U8_9ACTO|nr:peptide-methionine (S)-S-oxide reductase MsrA [Actinomyces lilanjuaniae]AYD90367.1 peptide-methionine (S)-S-oxide reductase MsrA [Actinomyces lilanjuaniae]
MTPEPARPSRSTTLPGREYPVLPDPGNHVVLGTPLDGPWPEESQVLYLAGGCFWGVERFLWRQEGVVSTAVGYMGGTTPNATYQEVCTGATGHAEAVRVVYDPAVCGEGGQSLLKVFWENHDSTQLNRHGNDIGTQYRSAVWTTTPAQHATALALRQAFQGELTRLGRGRCVTTIDPADQLYADFGGPFYLAEDYHQGYLHKNPGGYCNHGPHGVTCPVGVANLPAQVDVLPPQAV